MSAGAMALSFDRAGWVANDRAKHSERERRLTRGLLGGLIAAGRGRLLRDARQRLGPKLRRLGARDRILLRKDEEGHPLDAHAVALLLQVDDRVQTARLGQR